MNYGGLATFVFTVIAIPLVIMLGFFIIVAVPSWRRYCYQKYQVFLILLGCIAIPSALTLLYVIGLFIFVQVKEQQETARLNPVSTQPTRIAGVLFPIGSQLHYEANSNGSTTPIAAESDTPIQVGKLSITALKDIGVNNNSFEVALSGSNIIDGLPCKNTATFRLKPYSSAVPPENWQLMFCELDAQQQYGDFNWPAGSTVANDEQSGWLLNTPDHLPADLNYVGFELRTAFQMWLDQQQQPLEWRSYLAAKIQLGAMQYPEGTEIQKLKNGNLIFSPGYQPMRNTQLNMEVRDYLAQTAAGEIIGTFAEFDAAYQAASKPPAPKIK
jgi:hypothetical protein